jgi:glycosyltransferase involved in cell wall biosynthesis
MFDGENTKLLRTARLAGVLRSLGHEVVWWTSAFDHFKKRHRVETDLASAEWEGGQIRLLRGAGYRRNVSFRRFRDHAQVAAKFAALAPTEPRPDVILASLPTVELAHEAVRFGATHDVPVVVDVRDPWPDAIVDLLPEALRPVGRLALWPMRRRARAALRECASIVGISPGYLSWAHRVARRAPGATDVVVPIGYVSPTGDPQSQDAAARRMANMGVDARKKICWYVGSFGKTSDLDPVLRAARAIASHGRDDIQFVISGEGELAGRWKRAAEGLPNVVFTGWIDENEALWLGRRAAIGLQAYAQGAPQALPNKLFEYMSAGVPILSSLRGESEEFLARHDCGITYRAGDPKDCLEKLLALLNDEARSKSMGARARTVFAAEYDGRSVLPSLARHLERVVRSRRDRGALDETEGEDPAPEAHAGNARRDRIDRAAERQTHSARPPARQEGSQG